MQKRINDNIIVGCCLILIIGVSVSCNQKEPKTEGKLVFKEMPDGNKRVIGAMINDKKQGLWVSYDDSGRVTSHDTFINDSLTGESIGYFEVGTISSIGNLKNGQREGEWIIYYEKDKIAQKGSYKNGYQLGIWEYFIEEGKLDKKVEYFKDGTKKNIEDNHLTPPVPNRVGPSPISDSNNHAIIK